MTTAIYTIGYQKMTQDELVAELHACGVEILVDVRSKPYSRKKAFNKPALENRLSVSGIRYRWAGQHLGGFSEIKENAIADLADLAGRKTVCIMCMEADPDQCHRSYEIGRRLADYGVGVHHLVK